ncbi:hypothetical protein JHK84_049273 [Glycine max]|nr:hypothetical protein JHK84_049273 [Glycine max]
MILQLKLLALSLIWWSSINVEYAVAATRNPRLINTGCSQVNASNPGSFFANVNDSILEMREEISNDNKHFGTAYKARGEVLTYAMFQCRNYVSKNDCLACFNTASTQIRNCSKANGARVIYNDCFLRENIDATWEVAENQNMIAYFTTPDHNIQLTAQNMTQAPRVNEHLRRVMDSDGCSP